jgi:Alpha/beta hydrolase domain
VIARAPRRFNRPCRKGRVRSDCAAEQGHRRSRWSSTSLASDCRQSRFRSAPTPDGTSTRAQPSELADRDGSLIPFARTKEECQAAGDPRPSLEERYGSREAYVAKVKAAAEALVAERLLLPADAAAYVKTAEACDRF